MQSQGQQQEEKKIDFGFGILTNPPFEDEENNTLFYNMININTKDRSLEGTFIIIHFSIF